MTDDRYLKLIEKYPELTADGFGIEFDKDLNMGYGEQFAMRRQALIDAKDAFIACWDWIESYLLLEKYEATYALKHRVEHWLRDKGKDMYVPQGAFILAAYFLGMEVERIAGSTNAMARRPK